MEGGGCFCGDPKTISIHIFSSPNLIIMGTQKSVFISFLFCFFGFVNVDKNNMATHKNTYYSFFNDKKCTPNEPSNIGYKRMIRKKNSNNKKCQPLKVIWTKFIFYSSVLRLSLFYSMFTFHYEKCS